MINGIDERKLLPAIVFCFCVFVGGCLLLAFGCAVRHLPNGTTAPATTFEQVLAWNASAAQANDGFADNVIGLQRAGFLSVPDAKTILLKQAAIASADARITTRITAAAACGAQQAGANATPAQLDSAAAGCSAIFAPAIGQDIVLILGAISDLNTSALLAVKDPVKKQALSDLLATIEALIQKISSSLVSVGVLKSASLVESRPLLFAEVQSWQ
jgi:hypothetical protein